MTGAALSPRQLSLVAGRFRVLAVPARLRILQHLHGGPRHVSELVTSTGLRQANLSKHLQLLHAHAMVARVRRGRFVRYRIADPAVVALCDLMCRQVALARRSSRLAPQAPRRHSAVTPPPRRRHA
jgi:DNA-binding transcriptional ArsR family regulator